MKILDKLRGVRPAGPGQEDIMRIARVMGPLMDKVSLDVFAAHNKKLLAEPATYVVPAVWGAKKEGALDETQKKMHQQIAPVVEDIFQAMGLKGLSGSQHFAIMFLIRGFIISKITHMIEEFKVRSLERMHPNDSELLRLAETEPLGNA